MFIYLIIYIPFVLSAIFDFLGTSPKQKKAIIWFWVIVFTLFRGLRWETGTDWDQFYYVFNNAHWDNIFSFYRNNENDQLMDYGYMFINALFNELGLSYTSFLLVTNFWIMWCYKDFSLRFTKYPILTFILIMNLGLPFPVRQTIAFATSLWGFRFAVEKRWVLFFIVTAIASLIHKGSIIAFVVVIVPYIVGKWHIKWWIYALVYASTFIIAQVFRDYISLLMMLFAGSEGQLGAYGEVYMQSESLSVDYGNYNGSIWGGLSYTLFFAALLWVREKYNYVCNNDVRYFEFFFFLYAFVSIIDNIVRQGDSSGMTEVLGRVTSTLDVSPLIFPLLFVILMPKFIKNKTFCFVIFFAYMLFKFWQQIPGGFYHALYIPYKSIFGI